MTEADRLERKRRWPYVLAGGVLLLAAIGFAAWQARKQIVQEAGHALLDTIGITAPAEFVVASADAGHVRLEDVRFEGGPTASEVEVRFDAGEAVDSHFRSLRVVEPTLRARFAADGAFAIVGLEALFAPGGAESSTQFPNLPDFDRVEIEGAVVRVEGAGPPFDIAADLTLTRIGDDRYVANVKASAIGDAGWTADGAVVDGELAMTPEAAVLVGRIDVAFDDPARALRGGGAVWLDARTSPDGALRAKGFALEGHAASGTDLSIGDLRGRFDLGLDPAGGVENFASDLQIGALRIEPATYELATLVADARYEAASLTFDAVGASGDIHLTVDSPQSGGRLAISANGKVDASHISAVSSSLAANGFVRFAADVTADTAAMMRDADYRHVAGSVDLIIEPSELRIAGLAENGSARGELNVKLDKGAATLTTPGLLVGGVQLPQHVIAGLPIDFRRAFEEPAFVRLGGPSMSETKITAYESREGGIIAFGNLGLGVSNPNLAVFVEGNVTVATTPEGTVEQIESDRLTTRLVDTQLGPARVGGEIVLERFSGAGDAYDAEAAIVSLGARIEQDGFTVQNIEIDLTGPMTLNARQATLDPAPGGKISVTGYSGPLLALPRTLQLTLTGRGARKIVYDRAADLLETDLDFRGFRTRGVLSGDAADGGSPVEMELGGFGFAFGKSGAVLRLRDAAAEFPKYDVALAGGDARIAFGGETERTGRLTIREIRHLAAAPLTRPLSLELDVRGRGDDLSFDGALIAANDRARLAMTGEHHLGTGDGFARLRLGPVVFAPGVLQPQDFAPTLYNVLLETIGEAAASAEIGWDPNGFTREFGEIDFTIDKLRTSEIRVERAVSTFNLEGLFSPKSAGPQRLSIGVLDVGVPLTRGVIDVNLVSPDRIEAALHNFELFGGRISSQQLVIDPGRESFEAVLLVKEIDLASILAFAEFGELQATGKLEGSIPLRYENGELRINGGFLTTQQGGGNLRYRPRDVDKALGEVDRSSELALKALSNFAYDEISIGINELENEELRLDIHISGKSVDLWGGVPFEFNIVIEGPIRQLLEEHMAPIDVSNEVNDLIGRSRTPAQPVQ